MFPVFASFAPLPNAIVRGLTYPAGILTPLACALAFLSLAGVLLSVKTHWAVALVALGPAIVFGLLSFVIDIVLFAIARSRINDQLASTIAPVRNAATFGSCVWLHLVAVLLLCGGAVLERADGPGSPR